MFLTAPLYPRNFALKLNKNMKKNLGSADRIIRILIAAVVVTLYALNIISGTWAIVLLIVSAVFVLTSFLSFCPIYWILGIKSLKNNTEVKS